MTEVYRTTSIDLNRTISDLTVKDFLKILPIYQICVDFSQYPPGPLNTPLLDTKKGVKFLTLPLVL